ncbi:endonuclease VII protein [Vibrio phage 4141]|uniref:Endonuclease VII protein n=2 Tax=Chatterjeevirus TaxID=2732679 RepID=A0AAX4CYX3_9CAUD|nr:endonuclease VII [Vibrio phage N4]ACR16481.1 putative 13.5 kDa protein [Vibrio phage N4]
MSQLNRKQYKKEWQLKHRYGITYAQYLELIAKSNSRCNICDKVLVPQSRNTQETVCIDHCHETGAIRGILCNRCNIAIGILGDNHERLKRALAYLEKPYEIIN